MALQNVQFVYNSIKNGYGLTVKDDSKKTKALFKTISAEFYTTCFNIANKYPLTELENRKYFYEMALTHAEVAKLGPTNIENAKAAVANPEGGQAYEQAKKNMAASREKAKTRDSAALFAIVAFGILLAVIIFS